VRKEFMGTKLQKKMLFKRFRDCGENIDQVSSSLMESRTQSMMLKAQFGWRTRDQIMDIHKQNATVVNSIIEEKVKSKQWRFHPDTNTVTEYWVCTESFELQDAHRCFP
jgi:hypothetical protein